MKVIVTGASGFLGQALLRALAARGVDAVGVSRREAPGLVQVGSYADAPAGDVLLHLAETSDRRQAESGGIAYEREALTTLQSLLDKRFSHVVYASSAVLYGDRTAALRKVEDPIQVVDVYTRIKYASEQAVLAGNGIAARLVNLYGPGMAMGNVLTTILSQVQSDGPVRVLDTSPVRDFLWINDAAQALASMALNSADGIFNVGTGIGTSILQLAQTILAAAGQSERSVESATQADSGSRLVVDIAPTVCRFGWRPATSLQAGIATLIKSKKQ